MHMPNTTKPVPQIGGGITDLISILAIALGLTLLCVTEPRAYCANDAPAQTSVATQATNQSPATPVTPSPTVTMSMPAHNPAPTTAPAAAPDVTKVDTDYSWQSVGLVILVVALLAFLFATLIKWSARIEQTSYLGNLYRESVEETEFHRLAFSPHRKLEQGDYIREIAAGTWIQTNPPPTPDPKIEGDIDPDPFATLDQCGIGPWAPGLPGLRSRQPGDAEIQAMDPATAERESLLRNYYNLKHIWDSQTKREVNRLYLADMAKQREKAKEKAVSAVDIDLTVLRGRTPAFILEFTAVVIIIFAAVILGILNILKSDQIGTLLAAIAGYVLGRATTRGSENGQPEKPASASPSPNTASNTSRVKSDEAIKESGPGNR